jgi:beta-lactamase superfamily II metal-dependent hydrolase
MYNQQNLGDCFLLKFNSSVEESYLLIDFGSYEGNNTGREQIIANNIKETIKDKKLTIVLTHQHKDHYSGFLHAGDHLKHEEENKRELWLSYLDSEKSKEGQAIRSVTEKFWRKSKKAKAILRNNLDDELHPEIKMMLDKKDSFDLFAEEQSGGDAITKLLKIAKNNVRFLTPGDCFMMPGTNDELKVYVLGPPFDNRFLTKQNPNKSEEVQGLNSMMEMANMDISGSMMLDALTSIYEPGNSKECDFPFSQQYINKEADHDQKKAYESQSESWRKIDSDWLSEIGRLSLYMDKLTNNTSLVLAFEVVSSKKVMLFVGDAQIGNWQSWFNVEFKDSDVTGEDLLSRTVVYKAGHHSSLNATLKEGLDLMNEKELVILIPVNQKVSEKYGFHMLKPGMLKGFNRKSQGRVLRSDTVVQNPGELVVDFPFCDLEIFGDNIKVSPDNEGSHLWIEVSVE